jgi:hypothetical protein
VEINSIEDYAAAIAVIRNLHIIIMKTQGGVLPVDRIAAFVGGIYSDLYLSTSTKDYRHYFYFISRVYPDGFYIAESMNAKSIYDEEVSTIQK